MLSESDIRNVLRHRCEAAGGQKSWAIDHGVSPQYVCDILRGRKEVSERVAALLGYDRRIQFYACNTANGDS